MQIVYNVLVAIFY